MKQNNSSSIDPLFKKKRNPSLHTSCAFLQLALNLRELFHSQWKRRLARWCLPATDCERRKTSGASGQRERGLVPMAVVIGISRKELFVWWLCCSWFSGFSLCGGVGGNCLLDIFQTLAELDGWPRTVLSGQAVIRSPLATRWTECFVGGSAFHLLTNPMRKIHLWLMDAEARMMLNFPSQHPQGWEDEFLDTWVCHRQSAGGKARSRTRWKHPEEVKKMAGWGLNRRLWLQNLCS